MPCSDALEGSEAPDLGKVTLECCTRDVAAIEQCEAGDRVSVFDVSTVERLSPAGLDILKECIDANGDGADKSVQVTLSSSEGEVGFTGLGAADSSVCRELRNNRVVLTAGGGE